MKQQRSELKAKALNTQYSKWRRLISTLLITLMAVTVVVFFGITIFIAATPHA